MSGLYLHVPFCEALCSYCHFGRTCRHDAVLRRRTVEATIREFEMRRDHCAVLRDGRRVLETAYVGGGTPSVLEPDLLIRLLAETVDRLPKGPDFELTVEANPESLCRKTASAWSEAGVSRVSLGVQSLDREVLRHLGRRCDPRTARRALSLACRMFDRVAADWIIGPAVRKANLLAELDEAIDLGVEHISLYILEMHPGTPLTTAVSTGRVRPLPDSLIERLYLDCCGHLAERGFAHYEVSNFARPGVESRHNRAYWSGAPYLALGPSASGYYGRRRYTNEPDVSRYIRCIECERLPEVEIDPLDRRARRLERIVLHLRTSAGISLAWLPQDALDLQAGTREGLWTLNEGRLRLTGRGWLRLDTIEERLAVVLG